MHGSEFVYTCSMYLLLLLPMDILDETVVPSWLGRILISSKVSFPWLAISSDLRRDVAAPDSERQVDRFQTRWGRR